MLSALVRTSTACQWALGINKRLEYVCPHMPVHYVAQDRGPGQGLVVKIAQPNYNPGSNLRPKVCPQNDPFAKS
jgi:hypothetical protein